MTRIADLWQLQEIDSALDTRRASLEDAQARLGESEELNAARATHADAANALANARTAQKDVETEADDLKSKIAAADTRLYSGTIKNPKELADLQADVESLKRQLSALEDRDLEALGVVEAAEQEERARDAEVAALDTAWREEQAELTARIARLDQEIAAYEEQRAGRREYVEPDWLQTYEHVRRAHQGRGVARLDRNLCLGCRISLPLNIVNRARSGNAMVQCPNCERILYA